MSDFLTNLAARALGAPTLRPRTRSRFEPEPDASPWLAASSQDSAVGRGTASPGPPVRSGATLTPQSERRLAGTRDPATAPRLRPRASSEETPAHEVAKLMAPPRELRIENVATQEIRSERVIEKHDTTVRVEVPATRDADIEPPRASEPRHRYDEQPPRIEKRERRETPSPITVRDARPAPPRSQGEPAAASEPVIHVSIGRVEVRAVTPPPAPQRARARNAPMTVEDYAARKNAKGRP